MQDFSLDYFKKLQFVCQKSRRWSSFKVKVNYICYFNWYISPIILTERKIQLVWQKFTKNSWLLPPSFHMFSKWSVVKTSTEFNNSKSLPPHKKMVPRSTVLPLTRESQLNTQLALLQFAGWNGFVWKWLCIISILYWTVFPKWQMKSCSMNRNYVLLVFISSLS